MNHIKCVVENKIIKDKNNKKIVARCGECQTSCQSACKTSCTVANQTCEKK
jgi:predicted ribosomally synthesized six-cysteine peptide SCIFF